MKILPTSWVPSLRFFESFPPSHLGNSNKFDCTRFVVGFGSQCRLLKGSTRLQKQRVTDRFATSHPLFLQGLTKLLASYDCAHRASVCTCTAVDACVRIDCVDVTLRDSSYRALWQTCTACCAVFCNSVSHNFLFYIGSYISS